MVDDDAGWPDGDGGVFARPRSAAAAGAEGVAASSPEGVAASSPDGLDLAELRARIDVLDREIVALLNERAQLGLIAGEIKRRMGRSVPDPGREAEVLTRVAMANAGPFPDEALAAIYREIMRTIVGLEERGTTEGER